MALMAVLLVRAAWLGRRIMPRQSVLGNPEILHPRCGPDRASRHAVRDVQACAGEDQTADCAAPIDGLAGTVAASATQ